MALWCRNLPKVSVPRSDTPKPLTIVLPYYEAPKFFLDQVAHWRTFADDLRANVSAIVVDDGSPVPAELPGNRPFPVRLFRIHEDRRWNWLAARNIGAHHAADGWLLLTDMDHQIPEATLRAVLYGVHDPKAVYAFERQEHTGEVIHPHSASFLMTRRMFWKIGGYDEALSGHYGTDGEYRRRLAKVARMAILRAPLVRFEFVGDSSVTRYERKQPQDAKVRELIAARGRDWAPKTLSFPYHEVA